VLNRHALVSTFIKIVLDLSSTRIISFMGEVIEEQLPFILKWKQPSALFKNALS
jgi:hypothetical protein